MIWLILFIILMACIFLPSMWVKLVLHKYSEPEDRYRDKGSGAELARHLLDRFELGEVGVEETDKGDHYDPQTRTVRLMPGNYGGYSLTAVTVAAHEVGHAIQHARGEALFDTRQRLVAAARHGPAAREFHAYGRTRPADPDPYATTERTAAANRGGLNGARHRRASGYAASRAGRQLRQGAAYPQGG